MSQVRLVKIKLKDKQAWLNWCEELKKREKEVLETLQNEGVLTETCFLSEDENAVYYFIEAQDFEKVKAAFKNSPYKIDAEHKEIKLKAFADKTELENLFYFSQKNEK